MKKLFNRDEKYYYFAYGMCVALIGVCLVNGSYGALMTILAALLAFWVANQSNKKARES